MGNTHERLKRFPSVDLFQVSGFGDLIDVKKSSANFHIILDLNSTFIKTAFFSF